jgi:hypothetical protein
MRIKTLLGLAAFAVSAATCVAQSNVYSVNIVGYVNVPVLANQFALVSNPLKGPSSSITNIVLSDAAIDTVIYKWNGTGYDQTLWFGAADGWLPVVDLNLGEAFFIRSPVATTVTFVGEVATGTVNQSIPVGTSLKANSIPVAQAWPGADVGNVDDTIYTWGGTGWDSTWIYFGAPDGWLDQNNNGPDGPNLTVGRGVAYLNKGTAAINWTRTFNP